MEAAYIGLAAIDWGQTRYIANNPERYSEMNPILGDHPSVGKVNAYFAATTLLQLLIADALPPTYRKIWIGGGVLLEGAVVIRNNHRGLSVNW